jgi:predicted O-methyltransferase YrrM
MDDAVLSVMKDYDARLAREAALQQSLEPASVFARRDEFLLAVGPETATVLNLLARGARAGTLLEIGTSYGYSTVYLAEAARATGGRVITLDLADRKASYAREQLRRAGLEAFVEFHIGNALDLLPMLPGPFDFVLIDLWKDLYVPCLDLIYDKLSPGALIAADNMLFPEFVRPDAERYQRRVRELDFDTVLLPVGSGVELSRRRSGGEHR